MTIRVLFILLLALPAFAGEQLTMSEKPILIAQAKKKAPAPVHIEPIDPENDAQKKRTLLGAPVYGKYEDYEDSASEENEKEFVSLRDVLKVVQSWDVEKDKLTTANPDCDEKEVPKKKKMLSMVLEPHYREYCQKKLRSRYPSEQYSGVIESLHGSDVMHGSSSSSLLAFTEYGNKKGHLIATGALSLFGKIPFGGEMAQGISKGGVNRLALSTAAVHELGGAVRYASSSPWNPEVAKKAIKQLYRDREEGKLQEYYTNRIKTEEARLLHWGNLTPSEKSLVQDSFPVLYGIKPTEDHSVLPVKSHIEGEVGLVGGAGTNEIKVIFVPTDRIKQVKNLLNAAGKDHIAVESLDTLKSKIAN